MSEPTRSPQPPLTLSAALAGMERGELTSQQLLEGCLDAIVSGPLADINAVVQLHDAQALRAQAAQLDQDRAAGRPVGPLAGVPLVIKDNICVKGQPAQAASDILQGFISPYDATVIARLRQAGALLIGRANQDELAMGSTNERSAYGPALNPHDRSRSPGGSSGGSAAAVAAGQALAALGSDTGGSIRQPAAHCGVVGLKPTYGRVSRFGLIAYASSLDQIGPLTRSVEDAARLLQVIAGHDPMDMTSARQAVPQYLDALQGSVRGLRVGLVREAMAHEGLHPSVAAAMDQATERLERAGAQVVQVSLPHMRYAIAAYYLIATAEASSNLARLDGVRYGRRAQGVSEMDSLYERSRGEGFGPEVKRRIMLGTFVLSAGYYEAYYRRAQQVRTLIRQDFERAWEQVDLVMTPTSPGPAPRLGEQADPLQTYLQDIFTISCNLAGLPGVSVPAWPAGHQLPVGVQLMARPFDEVTLLRAAHHLEAHGPGGSYVLA